MLMQLELGNETVASLDKELTFVKTVFSSLNSPWGISEVILPPNF